ncbi:MAG: glycerol-3-phosphate 1-O-acyltransferase PlsY [Chloroflexota bacterium]
MIAAKFVILILVGYLIGSIPIGILVARRQAKVDLRQFGSGKIGATNVLRTVGRKAALLVALLDILKGAVAVFFAGFLVGHEYLIIGELGLGARAAQVLAALAAMTGHIWSVFLGFQGGRGVSTFFGGLAALCPVAALFGGEALIIGAGLSRYASLGSIIGTVGTYTILVPLTLLNGFPIEYLIYALVGTIMVIAKHRDNIARLLAGKERRLDEKVVAKGAKSPHG